MEVSPLSREVISPKLNLYPLDYRAAFAFSILLYPQPRGLALRLAFPQARVISREGGLRAYHVSCECQSGLGLASPPMARRLRQVSSDHLNLATHLFGPSLCLSRDRRQHLRLVAVYDVYQRFTCVALCHSILAPDHLDAGSHSRFLRFELPSSRMRLHCPRSLLPG
jgi:hypothetical protein